MADLKTAIRTLSFLRGPMAFASPLRIGELEITVSPSPGTPDALDVAFRNLRSGGPSQVLWTIE